MHHRHSLGIALLALAGVSAVHAAPGMHLQSARTDRPAVIDGIQDPAWDKAEPLALTLDELPYKPSNGYDGMKSTQAELRSLHDGEHVYFLVRYQDPSESLLRFPWVKQADGSWKQTALKDSTGHDNTWYEDKLAMFWNINQEGFEKKGCDMSCHLAKDGEVEGVKDISAGRHYTKTAAETVDIWHWKSTRTGPVGQADDQFLDAARQESKGWGRHNDEGGGGYYDNKREDGKAPAWMNPLSVQPHHHLTREDVKTPFDDTFKAGDMINGVVSRPVTGSRGDVTAVGVWKDGYWTLEIKRKLVTQGKPEQDVQFADLDRTYHFGLTVFDHSQINHLFHKKAIAFTFKR